MAKRIGFFRKTKNSNKKLIVLFEDWQKIRVKASDSDWLNKNFLERLKRMEADYRKEALNLLKNKKLKTSDDFLRATGFFQHGSNYKSYMLAVALAALSNHLGEPWGKNHYATAIDRLLLSIGLPQHFGTHFIKKNGRWQLEKFDLKTTNKERAQYGVEPLSVLKKRARDMDRGINVWETSLKD